MMIDKYVVPGQPLPRGTMKKEKFWRSHFKTRTTLHISFFSVFFLMSRIDIAAFFNIFFIREKGKHPLDVSSMYAIISSLCAYTQKSCRK